VSRPRKFNRSGIVDTTFNQAPSIIRKHGKHFRKAGFSCTGQKGAYAAASPKVPCFVSVFAVVSIREYDNVGIESQRRRISLKT
jgi:hypothetical protein